MNTPHLTRDIYSCKGKSNCKKYSNDFFGIICQEHQSKLHSTIKYFVEKKLPNSNVFEGPWMICSERERLNAGHILIPKKKVIDSALTFLKSPDIAVDTSGFSEKTKNYLETDVYFKGNHDFRLYMIEMFRNVTETNEDRVTTNDKTKEVGGEKVITEVRNNWNQINTIYKSMPEIDNYFKTLHLYSSEDGITVDKERDKRVLSSELSSFEKLFILFCDIDYDPRKYNTVYRKGYGLVLLEQIDHPIPISIAGNVKKEHAERKQSLFQKHLQNLICPAETYSNIPNIRNNPLTMPTYNC